MVAQNKIVAQNHMARSDTERSRIMFQLWVHDDVIVIPSEARRLET